MSIAMLFTVPISLCLGSDMCATEIVIATACNVLHLLQINDSVLVQEFLAGKEYVVDQVSRNGVHKVG